VNGSAGHLQAVYNIAFTRLAVSCLTFRGPVVPSGPLVQKRMHSETGSGAWRRLW
jgi:hypothetical protein